jgi:phosphoribosylformimino-5-aminoimidazole carboxamide ribotide isomerase
VIAGTKGLKDPAWLGAMSRKYPGKMVLALDMKGGKIQTHGWKEDSLLELKDVFASIAEMPLAGVLFTNVDVEGRAKGIDAEAVRSFVSQCPHLTIVSGGVTDERDVEALERMGVQEAVVGLSLYTGKLNHNAIWR